MNFIKITKERQKDLINKYLVDYVYNAAKVEGVNTDYYKTKKLVDTGLVYNLKVNDVAKLQNLKEAYLLLIDDSFYDEICDVETLCKINLIINGRGLMSDAGKIRDYDVNVRLGLKEIYKPNILTKYDVNEEIFKIIDSNNDDITKACLLYARLMKLQPFGDGNKRTSSLFASHYLLSKGYGVFSVKEEDDGEFYKLLVNYYKDDNNLDNFIYFLKTKCYSSWKIENDE